MRSREMNSLVGELRDVLRKRIDQAQREEVLEIVSTLCSQERAVTINVRITGARFIKLGSDGEPLLSNATDWVAVRDTSTNLDWSRENVGSGKMDWPKAKEA